MRNRLSRCFQALRIEVNQEIDELETALLGAAELVKPGGRLAVLSCVEITRRTSSLWPLGEVEEFLPYTPSSTYDGGHSPPQLHRLNILNGVVNYT